MTQTRKAADVRSAVRERTRIMGILNVTPDSFSDGGEYFDIEHAVRYAGEMARSSADMIDIGGESSRPGSTAISVDEELKRVMPVLKAVKDAIDIPVSVDTWKSEVARQVLSAGADIINDITALRGDKAMPGVIKEFDAGVILMHMKGKPRTMQNDPEYDDLMAEISAYLRESIDIAEAAGIDPDKIVIDPGIGFGKKLEHNLEILRELGRLKSLGKTILVGSSRKSFLGEITGRGTDARLFGTAASVAAAAFAGADIVRVHDVGAMLDVVRVIDAIKGQGLL
ncbi:MAG: dihydropteroate synthase [Candidatus Omnitrophica bacterium]|nr:dihydropteroate synthase [Candidatus Omnitrophota bacterium]MBU1128517.1 dihydropteroate synthase [Candidatus Omnitrophota bacterium]MBU1657220.1 dihydropteroate synthase [Candidatus Omnitrophota bacterium]MBU1784455.1 dihydropteroate synthase [Candidatus Omnitrophota bacterium]MBU1851354.1 dihydropteroate synthase [Candidatus Omnitrophota bacterium]